MNKACPVCGSDNHWHHDEFEDMHICMKCRTGFMPEELGLEPNKNSGLAQLVQTLGKSGD